ncbi:HAD family hydrolase [Saccharothrix longispora]|uniref:Hydrolase of the HAD superfamily n=1 Tax=Saccharothrix longispora TaxID=33920 RepID=A0ABU1Q111_9PSEU|nr:HAD family hydrolase [Saccharothrix longispora]MDR6596203.1 putative hydrolase of the HAD superfamily [Saccharothrix longispora]
MTTAAPTFTPRRTGEIRAVCLDVDDTLVDYSTSSRAALAAMVGNADAWPLWQRITDEHCSRLLAGELEYESMRNIRTRAFFAALGEELDQEEATRRELRRQDVLASGWRLFPDVVPCLEWLRATGLPVAAVSNASGHHQRVKIATLGLAQYFDTVLIAGEVGAAKPDRVIFDTACADLGVELGDAIHVGDRLHADAIGARDAGMRGVWLNRQGPREGGLPTGIAAISSLAELPELLVCELSAASA